MAESYRNQGEEEQTQRPGKNGKSVLQVLFSRMCWAQVDFANDRGLENSSPAAGPGPQLNMGGHQQNVSK